MAARFVEGGFRLLAVASGIGTLVAGCFTANRLITILQTVVPVTTPSELINAVNPNVITYTQASAGLAIGIGLLSIFLLCSIVLRIGKFKAGKVGKGFLLVDILVIFLCLVGLGTGGVIGALGADIWTKNFIDPINSLLPVRFLIDPIIQIRDALAATAAVSLFTCLLFVVLEVWMVIFTAKHWSNQQYT
ncbi:uncharacterized protein LOC135332985 [Halichondria panicea]|uniref:uncharacterized protein LOC135332985 n=1 Tax=Halichondria panicea TaxID=6063 RepID=UPI00312B5D91